MEANVWEQTMFKEEVGYWGISGTDMGESGTVWIGPTLMMLGSEEQKATHLPVIASGSEEGVWCTGYSEPDAGSDLANLQTSAVRDGGDYIINGQKVWRKSAASARRFLKTLCRRGDSGPGFSRCLPLSIF